MINMGNEQYGSFGIGSKLKKLLKERRMTLKELAKVSGVSINTLYGITRRDSFNISSSTLNKITSALNIPKEYFFAYEYSSDSVKYINTDYFNKKMFELGFNLRQISNALQEISDVLSALNEEV